jgi:hypothetical protein
LKKIRIGCGAGYAADRWEPALELIETSALDYLVFECLAERTIALGQLDRQRDATRGYNPYLEDRWRMLLRPALERNVRIITNMGAANPLAAAQKTLDIAKALGISIPKIAVIIGDDVLEQVRAHPELVVLETGEPVGALGDRLIAANAYLGADSIREALATGADIVITGRVADPSLFVGPMLHAFGWNGDDWAKLGKATALGHLLECAGQVTGGYFADPGVKDVLGLDRLGFPFAEIDENGDAWISKPAGSGGVVSPATLTEQILYECGNPAAYVTPDCIADFSRMIFRQTGPDVVEVHGAVGHPRTDSLKVTCCYAAGSIGEAHVGYAGPNALARAELAASIVRSRIAMRQLDLDDLRIELIGLTSLHGEASPHAVSSDAPSPYEVRLRVAGRSQNRRHAEYVAQETQSLLTNGPAGGGGELMLVRDIVGVQSVLMPRAWIKPKVTVIS